MFINVGKKYDWDNLSENDIIELIEDKKKKEKEKLIQSWPEKDIRVEKGKWGKIYLIKGKIRKELSKSVNPKELTLEDAIKLIDERKKAGHSEQPHSLIVSKKASFTSSYEYFSRRMDDLRELSTQGKAPDVERRHCLHVQTD